MLDIGPGLYFAISGLVVAVLSYCRKYSLNHSRPPLPPGPTPLPVLGNVLSLDSARPWLTFNAWRSTYGDIIYAHLLSKPVLIVNSEEVAKDLFDRRSSIYSDRPQSIVYGAFASDFNMGFMPYGNRWRLHRRIFHQSFHQAATPAHHDVQLRSAHKMLFNLLQDPSNYPSHFQMFTLTFMLSIIYDCEAKAKDDHVVHAITRYGELIVDGFAPAAMMLMEIFPFLLQLPSWFPGATFKRTSLKCIQAGHDVKEIPFQYVKERMSANDMGPCLVADALNRSSQEDDVNTTAVKEAASVAFTGILPLTQTTATLLVFFLAMVLNPEVQAKAQAEIDLVVGKDRLPNFDDRPALPYVEAILRETLRWHPVIPMGVPHATTTSDVYNGYFIPKALIYPNNEPFRAMTHDATKYPSPDEFKPERFFQNDGSLNSDTMRLGFGWGRRICVGRHVVDASLWIAIANFLAFFSVHKALDEHGMEIPVVPKFTTGFTVHPKTFPCRILQRFPDVSLQTLTRSTNLGPLC
ncbi:cytochrome P450 [Suillus subalutaceus]|uniref:cytochrome P450 n=1 Tax=Suillus subalutaceus TaxID=48586 RepID=UPI001B884A14|nr:cytochrome P450 [Suillus subalutaceus]KAG1864134.1 cytochrome P450 [Suillus subalutaceus]